MSNAELVSWREKLKALAKQRREADAPKAELKDLKSLARAVRIHERATRQAAQPSKAKTVAKEVRKAA